MQDEGQTADALAAGGEGCLFRETRTATGVHVVWASPSMVHGRRWSIVKASLVRKIGESNAGAMGLQLQRCTPTATVLRFLADLQLLPAPAGAWPCYWPSLGPLGPLAACRPWLARGGLLPGCRGLAGWPGRWPRLTPCVAGAGRCAPARPASRHHGRHAARRGARGTPVSAGEWHSGVAFG